MFLGARDIYTYLRFELTVEVWMGREMGDGVVEEEEEGKGVRGKDGIRSFSLSLSLSLSLCYDMLYSRLLYNVIHYTTSN